MITDRLKIARGVLCLGVIVLLASCSAGSEAVSTTTTSLMVDSTSTSIQTLPTTSLVTTTTTQAAATVTERRSGAVEIVGEQFFLGGELTNPGSMAEGLLMNSRMVQAIIDIEEEAGQFVYPDTGVWDAERNTTEFIAALPSYASYGLNAVTVNLQGGNPLDAPVQSRLPWRVSGYGPDGSLDPAWMDRLDRLLRAADDEGLAVIVGLFYFGQDHHLRDEAAVVNAVDNLVDWLIGNDHRNVLIEICNECNIHYDHEILRPRQVVGLMERVTERSGGLLPVSISLSGGRVPDSGIIAVSSYVLLHGNNQDSNKVAEMVRDVRSDAAFLADPKPIVFNEDSTSIENLQAAVSMGAGWGYHDKGANDYRHGFQAPPVDWSIGTDEKRLFFEEITRLTSP